MFCGRTNENASWINTPAYEWMKEKKGGTEGEAGCVTMSKIYGTKQTETCSKTITKSNKPTAQFN